METPFVVPQQLAFPFAAAYLKPEAEVDESEENEFDDELPQAA
jgi:hypothetical protein